MSRNRECGAGRIKTILTLLVLAAMVYVAFKVIPPYLNNYELLDFMKTEARFAAVNRKSPEEAREDVYKKIKELGIPAKPDNIRVEGLPQSGMRITVTYKVVVDLQGYELVLNFQPTADNSTP